jgi:hypothetical protein
MCNFLFVLKLQSTHSVLLVLLILQCAALFSKRTQFKFIEWASLMELFYFTFLLLGEEEWPCSGFPFSNRFRPWLPVLHSMLANLWLKHRELHRASGRIPGASHCYFTRWRRLNVCLIITRGGSRVYVHCVCPSYHGVFPYFPSEQWALIPSHCNLIALFTTAPI